MVVVQYWYLKKKLTNVDYIGTEVSNSVFVVTLYSFDTLYLHTSPKVCRETKDVTFSQEQCSNENTKGFHTFLDEKNNPVLYKWVTKLNIIFGHK